jgi:hypothetical protein
VDDAPVLALARRLKADIGSWVDPISKVEEAL